MIFRWHVPECNNACHRSCVAWSVCDSVCVCVLALTVFQASCNSRYINMKFSSLNNSAESLQFITFVVFVFLVIKGHSPCSGTWSLQSPPSWTRTVSEQNQHDLKTNKQTCDINTQTLYFHHFSHSNSEDETQDVRNTAVCAAALLISSCHRSATPHSSHEQPPHNRSHVTSCESFLHLWQQTELSVTDEGQSGARVVCPRRPANTSGFDSHHR